MKKVNKLDLLIVFFSLLAVLVYAAVPSAPTVVSPNATVSETGNVTLICSGSDGTNIVFWDNRTVGVLDTFRENTGWSSSSGTAYEISYIQTTADCDPCFIENISIANGCNDDRLFIYDTSAPNKLIYSANIVSNTAIIQDNLSPSSSYFIAIGSSTNASTQHRYKDSVGSTPTSGYYVNYISGQSNQAVPVIVGDMSDDRIAGIFDMTFNNNYTNYTGVLQNSTTNNFNWTGLTSGIYDWGCHICNGAECTDDYRAEFNVTFTELIITFQDEGEEYAWLGNISVDIIDSDLENYFTGSTINSTINATLPAGDYTVRYYQGNGTIEFYERKYDVTLTTANVSQLTLYVMNVTETNALNSTLTVISTLNEDLEDAVVNVMRYDIGTNSYLTTERVKTNFEGEADVVVVTDEFYKFIIEYPRGTTLKTTSPTYLTSSDITLVVDLGVDPTETFFNINSIDFNLTFTNATNTFTYTYNDPNTLFSTTCFRIYKEGVISTTLVNSSCSTSHAGSINLILANPENGTTYLGKAYASIGSTEYLLGTISHSYPEAPNQFGNMGLFIIIILTIGIAMMGVWSPSVALTLAPVPLLMGSIIGIIGVSVPIAITVFLGFLILGGIAGRSGAK